MSDIVTLDVGGQIFRTDKKTLMPSAYFRSLFDRWDTTEVHFIDRDSENFRQILALLRDPNHTISENMLYELQYYGIEFSSDSNEMICMDMSSEPTNQHLLPNITHKELEYLDDSVLKPTDDTCDGALHQLVATGTQNQSSRMQTLLITNNSSAWFRELESSGNERIISTGSSTEMSPTLKISRVQYEWTMPVDTDMISNLDLQFTLSDNAFDNLSDIKFGLIKSIELFIGGMPAVSLPGKFLSMKYHIETPALLKYKQKQIDKQTKRVSISIPFWFCKTYNDYLCSFPIIALKKHKFNVKIKLTKKALIYKPKYMTMIVQKIFLENQERRHLTQNPLNHKIIQCQSYKNTLHAGLNSARFNINFRHPTFKFYFACIDIETKQYLPIKHIKMIINNKIWVSSNNRTLLEHMYEQGYTPDNNIYMWNLAPSSINLSRIDSFEIDVKLLNNSNGATFYIFANNWNRMRYSDGIAGTCYAV